MRGPRKWAVRRDRRTTSRRRRRKNRNDSCCCIALQITQQRKRFVSSGYIYTAKLQHFHPQFVGPPLRSHLSQNLLVADRWLNSHPILQHVVRPGTKENAKNSSFRFLLIGDMLQRYRRPRSVPNDPVLRAPPPPPPPPPPLQLPLPAMTHHRISRVRVRRVRNGRFFVDFCSQLMILSHHIRTSRCCRCRRCRCRCCYYCYRHHQHVCYRCYVHRCHHHRRSRTRR
jgi:hypothetical protein